MIKTQNLSKIFDKITALDGLDFELKKGKITGLIGPDGAGKTTLLRICAGLLKQSGGKITINEKTPDIENNEFLEQIGYMPQRFGLYENLSCYENLRLYAKLQSVENSENRIKELLDFVNLTPFKDRFAGSLSGGMKQKLSLILTLLKSPKILLLDEPGVGVDPITRASIIKIIKNLKDTTIFWATSYLDEALFFDEILLLDKGKIIFKGRAQDALETLENKVIEIEINGDKKDFLDEILALDFVLDAYVFNEKIHALLNDDFRKFKDDLSALNANYKKAQPNFEDAYIKLLGVKMKPNNKLFSLFKDANFIKSDELPIRVKNLSKNFAKFKAVDNVSFEVERGEIFGLLGSNGAGKSTTFRMLCGLLKKSGGETLIFGKNVSEYRQNLGYMAQKFSLYENLSVKNNIEFFAGLYNVKNEVLKTMIELFALKEYENMLAASLPLGIKQRLALVCALMHAPSVLFLDEATSGADFITRKEFWKSINALSRLKISIIITTHLMDEAELCDKVALMDSGKIIALGKPDELKKEHNCQNMNELFIKLLEKGQK